MVAQMLPRTPSSTSSDVRVADSRHDYDVFAIGLQESVGEETFDAFEQLLLARGLVRLDLAASSEADRGLSDRTPLLQSNDSSAPTKGAQKGAPAEPYVSEAPQGNSGNHQRSDYIHGRGDGSILSQKYTGTWVVFFVHCF